MIVPGGHVSGLLAHIKSGNVPLSVFLTSFASLISPITIIFWLTVITSRSNNFSVDPATSFIQLLLFVLIPFVFGMIVKVKFQKFTNLIFKPLDVFLKILIVVVSIWTPIDLASYILENIQQGSRSQLQSKPVADLRSIAESLGIEHKGLQKAKLIDLLVEHSDEILDVEETEVAEVISKSE